jgi:DNA-binding NarL/FixJ family response regulator
MKHILLITSRENQFSEFMDGLTREETVEIITAVSSKEAIDSLADAVPNLVIIDEVVNGISGMKIARDILMKNAMVNQVLVSSLSPEEFHEASEGLGIMAQLPPKPDAAQAQIVLDALKKMP